MAAPANPTLAEIVAEGLAKASTQNPSAALTARAQGKWMEEIKNDVWKGIRRPTYLQVTSYGILVPGQSRYSNPTDYSSDLAMDLLDGDVAGTAQGGSASTITLAAGTQLTAGDLLGKLIVVTSGSGAASAAQCIAYDAATLVATVAPSFASAPAAASTYLIINREWPVEQKPIGERRYYLELAAGRPRIFFPIGDEDYGEFELNSPPDRQYVARLRYYANIMKLDVDSTLMSTLYLQWRNFWIKGIEQKQLNDNDDDRGPSAYQEYRRMLAEIRLTQQYGGDLSNLQQKVGDY